jgi:hypothetical protein
MYLLDTNILSRYAAAQVQICDAHKVQDFDNLHIGIATTGRGWAMAEDIANARPVEALCGRSIRPGAGSI